MDEQYLKPHILIFDTDASAAQVTSGGVRRVVPEATVTVVHDAAASLCDLEHHPDVVIVDPPRHTLAGLRLIRNLKAAYPAVHVIILTSVPTPALRRDMQLLGVDAYLEKPAPIAELIAAVRMSLQRLRQVDAGPRITALST